LVTSLTVGVLALQGDVREHARLLEACGAAVRTVKSVADLAGLSGLVLPGGESTAISMLAARAGLLEPLRELVAAGFPVYGSCAGLILLADRVLDGRPDQVGIGGLDLAVRRNAFGRQVASFEADVCLAGVTAPGEPFPGVFIRAPWVEQVGPEVLVLGRVAVGPESAASRIVAVRQGSLLGTSFHPELTADARVHRYFATMVRDR
jgi:pyridoxal 5'-phosphate synthase pdxT subunit